MTVLAAVGSVLGGLLGRSKQKVISAGDNFESHIGGLMNAAKKYGWNPLTLLQNGQAIGPTVLNTDNSAFGAGIANAFALAGDAVLNKRANAAKLNQYQKQNERLQSRLNAITLRAPVPGVFGRARLPSDPQVYGNGTDPGISVSEPRFGSGARTGPAGAPADLPPLVDVDPIDPRRGVDNKPVANTSGFMVVDNPYVGKVYVPTLDGDEPVDILDIPAVGYVGSQLAYQKGKYLSFGGGLESRPSMSRAEGIRRRDLFDLAKIRPKRRPGNVGRPVYDGRWVQ